jgi:hypothetical protein
MNINILSVSISTYNKSHLYLSSALILLYILCEIHCIPQPLNMETKNHMSECVHLQIKTLGSQHVTERNNSGTTDLGADAHHEF